MINAYLHDYVDVLKATPIDSWGEEGLESLIVMRGLIQYKTRLVRDFKGEEVTSNITVLFRPNAGLDHDDKILINGYKWSIINILEGRDWAKRWTEVFL